MKDISGWERLAWSKVAKGQEGMSKGAVVNGCQWVSMGTVLFDTSFLVFDIKIFCCDVSKRTVPIDIYFKKVRKF